MPRPAPSSQRAASRPRRVRGARQPQPLDRIVVRGLRARAVIGDNAQERRAPQELVINLVLAYHGRAGRTDRLADALDYRTVKKAVLRRVEASRHRLLEALAESIAQVCLADPHAVEVAVAVDKPGALRFADSVAVEIVRRR